MKLFRHCNHGERFPEAEYPLLPLALQQVCHFCHAGNDCLMLATQNAWSSRRPVYLIRTSTHLASDDPSRFEGATDRVLIGGR